MALENTGRFVIDMLGRKIKVPRNPQRIVSLVPSQSELLWYLGIREQIVGITRFCIEPIELRNHAKIIGGTKTLDAQRILDLKPDLVIANKEENTLELIQELEHQVPVWISDVRTLDDALKMISGIGKMCDKSKEAQLLCSAIEKGFQSITISKPLIRAAYFIWKSPWMLAGADTFINSMMRKAGFENVLTSSFSRYPVIEISELVKLRPQVLLFSSEPFPFKKEHFIELQNEFPELKMLEVDGRLFSWYGSALLESIAYFDELSKNGAD